MRKERITVRLSQNQMLVLKELTEALDTSYSLLVRSIVCDFLTRNEEHLERIITSKMKDNADHQQDTTETEG